MNAIHYLALIMSVVVLLTGCMVPNAHHLDPVDTAPDWMEPEEISPGDPDPDIQLFFDNTQSMFGFSGEMDSPISQVAVALTDLARFDDRVTTYRLVPDDAQKLIWNEADPLVIASSVMVREKDGYTYTGEFQHGGPLTAAFEGEPDPGEVKVLITDLMEQESELDMLTSYVEKLFRSNSRQQVRIYVANSAYDGFVSYPVVKEDMLKIKTTYYAGTRPFVVIIAGPVAGVEQIHELIMGIGISITQFMVENHRAEPECVFFHPGQALTNNILVEDPSMIRCSANLEIHPLLEDCFAYAYRKISANKTPFTRLSLIAQTDLNTNLSIGRMNWFQWETQVDAEGLATQYWQSCEPPENMSIAFSTLESGPVIPGRCAEETDMDDITVPAGSRLWELSILANTEAMDEVYGVQLELTIPVVDNPLASTDAFDVYDIPFAAYGNADKDPAVLTRIPDLNLMLSALAKLDNAAAVETVADVRIVIQNYEYTCQTNKEEER